MQSKKYVKIPFQISTKLHTFDEISAKIRVLANLQNLSEKSDCKFGHNFISVIILVKVHNFIAVFLLFIGKINFFEFIFWGFKFISKINMDWLGKVQIFNLYFARPPELKYSKKY